MNPLPRMPMRKSRRCGRGEWIFKSIVAVSAGGEGNAKFKVQNSKLQGAVVRQVGRVGRVGQGMERLEIISRNDRLKAVLRTSTIFAVVPTTPSWIFRGRRRARPLCRPCFRP